MVKKVIMKILDNFRELLSVYHKADIDEGCTLRDHIHIALLQRNKSLFQHTVESDDILTDN